MSKTDEEILRGFIEGVHDGESADGDRPDALAAFDRLTSRILPELPEGWRYIAVRYLDWPSMENKWCVELERDEKGKGEDTRWHYHGPTPRAACEAAIARIGKQP